MEFAVLVKAVPRSDAVAYDERERRLVREGIELVLNPYDQRAVRVALELRRPGETVSALSLGPPGAIRPLRELRALGIDRVVLLSDPAFVGSDTLATAHALRAGLERVGHDVVVAGARSTDSDTGQVPAEVAELLDVPLANDARSVRRADHGGDFDVTLDTPEGWSVGRVETPFVLAVGEKIAKPLKVAPEPLAGGTDSAVEVLAPPDVGVDPARVGAAGSPTEVGAVRRATPIRTPCVIRDGSPADRAREAARLIAARLRRREPDGGPLPPAPVARPDAHEVLVLVTEEHGDLDPDALGLISEVRRSLPGLWPSAVWVGPGPPHDAPARLARAGALGGHAVEVGAPPGPRIAALAVGRVLDARPRTAAALFLSDSFGREVAGRLAARRSLGLVGDAVGLRPDPAAGIVWTKPSFGGRTTAEITCRVRPGLATVRPGWFRVADQPSPGAAFVWTPHRVEADPRTVRRLREGREVAGASSLERRDVVVAVGMGVGGPAGVERIRTAIAAWDAGLVATRRVVDAGWVPRQLQLGLTGRSLAPRLAVLLGVSGAPNHMVGWQRAPAVIAVNPDPAAPVFRDVDVGIVGTVEEVLPPLVAAIAPLLERPG